MCPQKNFQGSALQTFRSRSCGPPSLSNRPGPDSTASPPLDTTALTLISTLSASLVVRYQVFLSLKVTGIYIPVHIWILDRQVFLIYQISWFHDPLLIFHSMTFRIWTERNFNSLIKGAGSRNVNKLLSKRRFCSIFDGPYSRGGGGNYHI